MKIRNIYQVLVVLLLVSAVSACFEDPGTDILLTGVAQLEIQEATTATGADVSKSYNRVTDGRVIKDSIRVNLVGAQLSEAITVSFAIDPTSTAVAGTHYTLISSGTVTIQPSSSFAFIYFNVIDDNILPGEVWKLKFNLTAATGDVQLSSLYSTFTRSMRVLCQFNRANFIGTYGTNEPGYGTYDNTVSADATNANAVRVNNFWDFGGNVQYVFNPANNQVTIPTQDVVMGGTTYTVGAGATAGTYDPCTYSFVVPYTVRLKSTGALQDSNTHTYTKK